MYKSVQTWSLHTFSFEWFLWYSGNMTYTEIIKKLKSKANKKNQEGMARFGIFSKNVLGIPMPEIKKIAKEIGKDQSLSLRLWDSGIYEARILAGLIGEPNKVTERQMNLWTQDFDNWAVCDSTCSYLFDKTPFAWKKIYEYVQREEEFVRRTGFTLMATLAVHDKKAKNKDFEKLFPLIKKYSVDERNFVKKAVNWALRQIGKRNLVLNKKAIKLAVEIRNIDSKSARWIASDAFRELTSEAVQKRLRK